MNEEAKSSAASASSAVNAAAKVYAELALAQLRPSKSNPRRRGDERKLLELAASIREKGVLEPLLVRPVAPASSRPRDEKGAGANGAPERMVCAGLAALIRDAKHFEIVAGERRFKAAQLAKLDKVPCIIRDFSDADALECQVVENDQREDVHPLDQAAGYRALMATGRYKNVDALARKLGKSRRFVYQRMELGALAKPVQKAFAEEAITATHAALLARLQPPDQGRGLEACFEREYGQKEKRVISSRALTEWIARHVHFNLDKAPWKKDDAALLPVAGACTTCPKRAGANPERFPDVKHAQTCTDPACYQGKLQAFVQLQAKSAGGGKPLLRLSTEYAGCGGKESAIGCGSWEEAKPGSCAHVQQALIVHEDEYDAGGGRSRLGQVLTVCAEKKCKKHFPDASSSSSSSSSRQQHDAARERRKARMQRETKFRVLRALTAAAGAKLDTEDLRLLGRALLRRLEYDQERNLGAYLGLTGKKRQYGGPQFEPALRQRVAQAAPHELKAALFELALIRDTEDRHYVNGDLLSAAAARYKVNAKQIAAEVAAESAAKKKKKVKVSSAPSASSAVKSRGKKATTNKT